MILHIKAVYVVLMFLYKKSDILEAEYYYGGNELCDQQSRKLYYGSIIGNRQFE